jgi:hypothetical protein
MEDKRVQQALAADLEFDLGVLLVALYPRSWEGDVSFRSGLEHLGSRIGEWDQDVHEASLRWQICRNCSVVSGWFVC